MGGRRRCTHGAAGRPAVRQGDPRGRPSFARGTGEALGGGRARRSAQSRRLGRVACGPRGRGRSGRTQARGLRLPAVLGADRQLDTARLGEALDHRLLRGRRGRRRDPPEDEQRRLDDGRLERLDELADDGRHQRRPCEWRAGRADGAELCLVLVGRDPPEGAARQLGTSPHACPPDRGSGAGSRRRRRQPRLRADRLDLRRRIHRAGPLGPGRAQQDLARLPADVRRDRLDRQLPDRSRDRIGRRGCGRDHGLRLQERLVEPRRIGRAARRSGLRHRRHDQGLRLARAGLEGHPRRAVLRPRLVDGHLGLRLQEHLERQERSVDDRRLWHRPSVRGRPRSEVGPGPGRGMDGLPS